MKRIAWIGLLMISAGCEVTEPFPQVNLKIEMRCSPPQTRAGHDSFSVSPDDIIYNGVILEFNQDGELLESVSFMGDDGPVLPVRRNQQVDIYIVANPTVNLSGVASKEEFLSTQSEYRANSAGRLEMTGHLSGIFDKNATVSVAMERTVAKITLDALVFKLTTSKYNYTGANLRQAYMEKTPATCGYDFSASSNYLDAYEHRIGIGYFERYPSVRTYTEGEYNVFEYDYPQTVYCYPNDSQDEEERNKFAVSYRLNYTISGVDLVTGEPIVLARYDDNCVHLVMPPLRPNTAYELERLTIIGARNKTVYLKTKSGEEEEAMTCVFKLTDMTSGEFLGYAEGEVEYEMQDS